MSFITVVPMSARGDSCCRGRPVGFEDEVGVVRARLHLERSAALGVAVVEQVGGVAAQEPLADAHALADLELVGAGAYLEPQLVPGGGGQRGDDGRVRDAEPRRPLDEAGVDLVGRARLPQRRPHVQVRERLDPREVRALEPLEALALLRATFAVLVAETERVPAFVREQEDEPVEVVAPPSAGRWGRG